MSALTGRSPRDANRVPATFGVSSVDGVTVLPIEINPSTGQLLVEASVTVSGANGAILDGVDATIKATVRDLTNSNPLATQLVDANGDAITSFGGGTQYTDGAAAVAHPIGTIPVFNNAGTITAVSAANPLPVSATISTAGLATSAKQDTGNASLASIDGKITAVNTGAVVVASSALPTGASTAAKQPALGTAGTASADVITVQGIASMTALKTDSSATTQPVSGTVTANAGTNLNTSALALAATQTDKSQFTKLTDGTDTALITAAGELNVLATAQPGVDIGDVTINNASGAAAVNIQDGGNSITVDNGGTFAVQATLTAETTKVIGTVNQGTSPWVTSNATTSVVGNGASATAQRVTLSNDSTGIIATVGAVTAITNALPTGSNAIGKLAANSGVTIGAVEIAAAQTLATVTTVTTLTGTTTLTPGTAATNLGKAEDAAHTTGDVGVFTLGVRNDTLADTTNTTADYSQMSTDLKGRVMVAGAPRLLKGNTQTQLSNTTTETTIIAATASTFHDVYGIILANTGASTTKVSIRDDTAGTVRAIIEVPTLETRGFMLPVDSAVAQTAVNKNWTAQCGTATTALEVTAFYVSMV